MFEYILKIAWIVVLGYLIFLKAIKKQNGMLVHKQHSSSRRDILKCYSPFGGTNIFVSFISYDAELEIS